MVTHSVDGNAVSNGVQWSGGSPPIATANTDILTFIIVRDNAGVTKVFGQGNTDFVLSRIDRCQSVLIVPPETFFFSRFYWFTSCRNFFKTIDKSAGTDGVYAPDEIAYNVIDQKYFLAGTAADSNSRTLDGLRRDEAGTADFDFTLQSSLATENTTLRAMELDVNNNLVVAGIAGSVPWIAKSDNNGAIQWFATTNTADVRYLGLASDSNGNYYACGRTSLLASDTQAFVEKFDGNGNPGWGKQGYMLGRDVVLKSIDVNDRGEPVAVGYLEDDSNSKGYIITDNANTGDVMWDRTLSTDDTIRCTDCYIDSKDQIYVSVIGATDSYLVKYTPEGNMQWQRKTAQTGASISYKTGFL